MRLLLLPSSTHPMSSRQTRYAPRWLSLTICLAATALSPSSATAQPPEAAANFRSQAQISSSPLPSAASPTSPMISVDAGTALSRRGSVVFRDTPLSEVILILSDQWDIKFVAGAQIDGTVSGTFKNETLEKILDSLLTANGFSYRRIGNSLVVVADAQSSNSRPASVSKS